jgi:hypothetical protein
MRASKLLCLSNESLQNHVENVTHFEFKNQSPETLLISGPNHDLANGQTLHPKEKT